MNITRFFSLFTLFASLAFVAAGEVRGAVVAARRTQPAGSGSTHWTP
jgi:hypothetical protein